MATLNGKVESVNVTQGVTSNNSISAGTLGLLNAISGTTKPSEKVDLTKRKYVSVPVTSSTGTDYIQVLDTNQVPECFNVRMRSNNVTAELQYLPIGICLKTLNAIVTNKCKTPNGVAYSAPILAAMLSKVGKIKFDMHDFSFAWGTRALVTRLDNDDLRIVTGVINQNGTACFMLNDLIKSFKDKYSHIFARKDKSTVQLKKVFTDNADVAKFFNVDTVPSSEFSDYINKYNPVCSYLCNGNIYSMMEYEDYLAIPGNVDNGIPFCYKSVSVKVPELNNNSKCSLVELERLAAKLRSKWSEPAQVPAPETAKRTTAKRTTAKRTTAKRA